MTPAETSIWYGSAPAERRLGSEWCMLCQLSPKGQQGERPQVGGAVVETGGEGAGAEHVTQRVDAPGDVLEEGDTARPRHQHGRRHLTAATASATIATANAPKVDRSSRCGDRQTNHTTMPATAMNTVRVTRLI
jgi:hypothetical protein